MKELEQKIRQLVPSLEKIPSALPLPVKYDGMNYYFGKGENGGDEIVADFDEGVNTGDGFRIRGWGRIQYLKEENKTPEQLQNECAFFIERAINNYAEIQLHHVLQAIALTIGDEYAWEQAIDTTGQFRTDWGDKRHEGSGIYWDLTLPLSGQSEEVVKFLNGVLN